MAHAIQPSAVARDGARSRVRSGPARSGAPRPGALTPAELDLDARARQTWFGVLFDGADGAALLARATAQDSPIRHRLHHISRTENRIDPLEALALLLVELSARGASEAQLRAPLVMLEGVVADLHAGDGARTLEEIDRDEMPVDQREDQVTQERYQAALVGALTPELLEEQAVADEQVVAVLQERSRVARREARRLRFEALRPQAPAWALRRTATASRATAAGIRS